MKRIVRDRRLTAEDAARYESLRGQIAAELPDLIERHQERLAARDPIQELLSHLKTMREQKGLSLADLSGLTGLDRAELSELETGEAANATIGALARYAEAVGKHLVVELKDA